MPTPTIEYRTDTEPLIPERAAASLAQMRQVAAAPKGTALDACERVAPGSGRRLGRDTLAHAAPARADAPKKGRGPATRGGTGVG